MGNLRQVQGVTLAPKLGPGVEETLRCQRGAGAYFRISVMVSFRSFPWKGREPVSISNCREQGSVQALVPSPKPPHLLPPRPLSSMPRRSTWIKNCVCPSPLCQSDHEEQY